MFVVKDNSKAEHTAVTSMKEDMRIALSNRRVRDMLILLFMLQMGGLMLQPIITLCVDALNPTGDALGGTVVASGLVFSLIGISGAVSAPLWGRYGQKFGYYRVLVLAFAGAGIVHIIQSQADTLTMFCVMQAIIGLFIVGVQPALNAIMVNSTDADFHGRVFGIATTFNQLGCMAGPLVGGVLSGIVGNMAVFACVGLMHLVTATVIFCRERNMVLSGK
jgi:DHA1 family multidrug resistance protein-like MFS transporter